MPPTRPIPLSGLVPSLLHGGFAAPARLGGVEVVSLSATLRPAAHSVTLALLAADETAIGGLLKLDRPSLNLQATGLDGPSPVVRLPSTRSRPSPGPRSRSRACSVVREGSRWSRSVARCPGSDPS